MKSSFLFLQKTHKGQQISSVDLSVIGLFRLDGFGFNPRKGDCFDITVYESDGITNLGYYHITNYRDRDGKSLSFLVLSMIGKEVSLFPPLRSLYFEMPKSVKHLYELGYHSLIRYLFPFNELVISSYGFDDTMQRFTVDECKKFPDNILQLTSVSSRSRSHAQEQRMITETLKEKPLSVTFSQ